MLRLLYWLLMPLAALGGAAQRLRVWADERDRIARALPPGTTVSMHCACHRHELWYVHRYNVDPDDYRLVPRWPDDGTRGEFVLRRDFTVVQPHAPTFQDPVENMMEQG